MKPIHISYFHRHLRKVLTVITSKRLYMRYCTTATNKIYTLYISVSCTSN